MGRLSLPSVTLVAATSVNVDATIAAMSMCMRQVNFGDAILLTDAEVHEVPTGIRHVRIAPMRDAEAYSAFLTGQLTGYVSSEHVLICQWDGFIVDASAWDERFLAFDYIGAPWPQFDDGMNVGNGGFSLRSRRLLQACHHPDFVHAHPEDVAICRINRRLLERADIRFPDPELAALFSSERGTQTRPSFGIHGIFRMIDYLGADQFWKIYECLDHKVIVPRDYWLLLRQLRHSRSFLKRAVRLTCDRLRGSGG